jgi:hypothetical protein
MLKTQTNNNPPITTTTRTFEMLNLTTNKKKEEKTLLPPEHLFSDYIEITYLGFVILTGLTLNFVVLKNLLIEKKINERGGKFKVILIISY